MFDSGFYCDFLPIRRLPGYGAALIFSILLGSISLGCTEEVDRSGSADDSTEDSPSTAEHQRPGVLILDVEGAISPATTDYLLRGFAEAREKDVNAIVIVMDTPGGLSSSMRDIIKAILNSPIPVITYVSPAGARAASAGTYMLYASHVAAMAPSTHLGSATPVQMGGMPGSPEPSEKPEKEESDEPGKGSTAMERKVLEDAVAYIRALAERHNRNPDWAEDAVRKAVNINAREALERNVIDLVARDLDQLLEAAHGREVRMAQESLRLNTKDAIHLEFPPDWRHRLLSVIANPNVAYFLMIIGFYGIIFELSNPGAIYPGVIGAISLLLALFAFQVLPINYAGLGLLVLGLGLIVAEAFVPGFGVLGTGGIVAFVAGSVILMDEDNLSVSLSLIGGVAFLAAAFLAWVLSRLVRMRKQKSISGREDLMDRIVEVSSDFRGRGRVRMGGEIWWARCDSSLEKGQKVRVKGAEGLELIVEPLDANS